MHDDVLSNLLSRVLFGLKWCSILRVLQNQDKDLEDFKISDGQPLSSCNVILSVLLKTTGEEGYIFVEVLLPLLHVFLSRFNILHGFESQADGFGVSLLHKVKKRVDLPHDFRISAVVAEPDSKGSQNGARLAQDHAVFLPDWDLLEWKLMLHIRELLKSDPLVFVRVVR